VAKNPERGLGEDEDELDPEGVSGDISGDVSGEIGAEGEGPVQAGSSIGSGEASDGADGVPSSGTVSDETETPEVERE
jgi:hypothetical protein